MRVILAVDAIRLPLTGIGRYALELATALAQRPEIASLRYLTPPRLAVQPRLNWPQVSEQPLGRGRSLTGLARQLPRANRLHRPAMDCIAELTLARESGALFHSPNFYLPRHRGPSVVTVHDVSPWRNPEFHPPDRVWAMERALQQIVRRATRVITVSEHSRTAWLELTGMDPARVDVTPLAAGPEFQPRSAAACGSALQRHGLEFQRYLVFVGTIEPRKNIPTLLDAYAMLPAALRKRHPLVLVGHPGWRSEGVHARLRALSSRGEVRYLGYLPVDEVPLLTSGALALVLPSHDEGFGLPVVEAMASGVPVVCSDAASLPEVAGDVALMAPAEDASAFARQLQRALEDAAWREEAGRRGLERAATLSWPATTSLTVAAYQRAVTATGGL